MLISSSVFAKGETAGECKTWNNGASSVEDTQSITTAAAPAKEVERALTQSELRPGEVEEFGEEQSHLVGVFNRCKSLTGLPYDDNDKFFEFAEKLVDDTNFDALKEKLVEQNNQDGNKKFCIDDKEQKEIDRLELFFQNWNPVSRIFPPGIQRDQIRLVDVLRGYCFLYQGVIIGQGCEFTICIFKSLDSFVETISKDS